MELGKRVGATTLLVRTGYGQEVSAERGVIHDYAVDDLQEAATVIAGLLGGRQKKLRRGA